ncbi:hypothetical protein H6G01_26245 [Leptolyngbya sp. FACHB-17]|nr:hypothetical protein [Leptolyngbya sp. FACHB-17]
MTQNNKDDLLEDFGLWVFHKVKDEPIEITFFNQHKMMGADMPDRYCLQLVVSSFACSPVIGLDLKPRMLTIEVHPSQKEALLDAVEDNRPLILRAFPDLLYTDQLGNPVQPMSFINGLKKSVAQSKGFGNTPPKQMMKRQKRVNQWKKSKQVNR